MASQTTEYPDKTPAQFRLTLSVTPGNKREFELWRSGLSPMFAMDARAPRSRSSFGVETTSYQFADVAIAAGSSSAAAFDRTTQTIARSGLDNICLIFYLAGGCALDVEGRAAEVNTGDICILDMTRRSALRAPDFNNLSVILPRALLAPLVPNFDVLHGLILRRSSPLNTMLASHLRALFAEAPSLGVQDVRAAVRGTAALIAEFAGASPNGRAAAAQVGAVASLQAVRRIIEANLANPELGPEYLCRQLGMSRAKLYRQFEPIGGVREYIQQRRLMRAYQTITNPAHAHERVGGIAARCGFSNDSVFSRAFREAYGMSPTDLRNAPGRADKTDPGLSEDNNFRTMNRWLLGMDAAGR
jgi:AraC-like DNA-binding protein